LSVALRVTILQHRLLHYRLAFFERLRAACAREGIELALVHGQASPREAAKRDTGSLPWATPVENRWFSVGGRDLLWQPLPRPLRAADLVVIMQESRILSNYPLLVRRMLGRQRLAYWGHGRNFQSDRPAGVLERWKTLWTNQVDWWFAYTALTRDILVGHGFPRERVTCLDNAIDSDGFLRDLAGVTPAALEALARELDLASGAPLGIYCGSLYPDKRLELLAAAADRIHAAYPAFRLAVIGDGPSRAALEASFASRPWARCVGAKRGVEKAAYFRAAKVVLSPGAVGLHVLDSFCAGVPMFTTATARHGPEIVYLENGRNGFVTEDTASAYADAAIALFGDPERYARVAAAAKADSARYTLANMTENFMGGLRACLGAPGVATPAGSRA
jgi:L-malate glycosyltransferase